MDEFEWDEAKRQANIEKHGIDFEDAIYVFEGVTLEAVDKRFEYRHERHAYYEAIAARPPDG